jgi:hypothetical protein
MTYTKHAQKYGDAAAVFRTSLMEEALEPRAFPGTLPLLGPEPAKGAIDSPLSGRAAKEIRTKNTGT